MAYSVKGSPYTGSEIEVRETYDYEYPAGLDLKPGSEQHQKLLARILDKAQASHDVMKSRFSTWRKLDHNLTSFVPLDNAEKALQKQDFRRPVSIVVPQSYAILETILTYYMEVYFDTLFDTLEGVGPEDTFGAILLRHDLKNQFMRGDGELALYTQLRDGTVYGVGALSPVWHREVGARLKPKPTGFTGMFGAFFQTGETTEWGEDILWEGHRFENIDPYRLMPDPHTPIHRYQEGETFGWVDTTNRMTLLDRERVDDGLFNCRYLGLVPSRSMFALEESGRKDFQEQTVNVGADVREAQSFPVDVLNQYVNLIPKEYGIKIAGESDEYPQKWLFKVANDAIIIGAQPLGLKHNKYPVTICAPEFDGYTVSPLSRMELIFGLQGVTDWMISSHIANVRKTINDLLVIDPAIINERDVYERAGKAGGVIRLRRERWGSGVKDGIMQLPVADVTKNHVNDTNYVISIMEKAAGVSESLQGVFQDNAPERRTATEFSATHGGAEARRQSKARLVYAMTIRKMIDLMASQTQQLRTTEDFVKINGDMVQQLQREYGMSVEQNRLRINPSDLDIRYDISMVDGTLPASADGNLMLQLFQVANGSPELAQNLDITRMYLSLARRFGEKNIEQFLRGGGQMPVQVMPDQQVQQGVESGALTAARDVA